MSHSVKELKSFHFHDYFLLRPKGMKRSTFHSFGSQQKTSLCVTTTLLKRVRKGKIFVQPEAVKRRTLSNGSRNSVVKGKRKKNNPFDSNVFPKKRLHQFSVNVGNNDAVHIKAGRMMNYKIPSRGELMIAM